MSEFKTNSFCNENNDSAPDIVGITTFTSPYYFVPPSGSTEERPSSPPPGMLRFNTDIGRLEVWRNDHWATILGESPNLGNQLVTNSAGGTGTRGVWSGGRVAPAGGYSDVMDYISVSTLGDAQDFGDLAAARAYIAGGCASGTKGILFGGANGPLVNTIDKFIFASTGSRGDFGDTSPAAAGNAGGHSNGTRGVFGGMAAPSFTTRMDYITIESDGNSEDFGDMLYSQYEVGACGSSVRALFGAGYRSPGTYESSVEYVTVSTTGNTQDFGNLTLARRITTSLSNATRGIWSGGLNPGTNLIDFVTIASTGNAQDFGDLLANRYGANGAAASPTRGVFGGGYGPSYTNVCEFITIPTTGNSVDFGDLTVARGYTSACSNGHGGL
jgi:hypothetical protein